MAFKQAQDIALFLSLSYPFIPV